MDIGEEEKGSSIKFPQLFAFAAYSSAYSYGDITAKVIAADPMRYQLEVNNEITGKCLAYVSVVLIVSFCFF